MDEIIDPLCEFLEFRARYETVDHHGETRLERNERFGHKTDIVEPPEVGFYLLELYDEICKGVNKVVEGQPMRITWVDLMSWSTLTNRVITHFECVAILKMHNAWCISKGNELNDIRVRMSDEAEQRAKAK